MGAAIVLDSALNHHRRMLDRIANAHVLRIDEMIAEFELTLSHGVTLEWLTGLGVVAVTPFGPKLYWVTRTRQIGDVGTTWFITLVRQWYLSPRDPRVPRAGHITFLSGDLRCEVPIVS